MTLEIINVGTAPNSGDGDPARTAFQKTNNNFNDLYPTSLGGLVMGGATSGSVIQLPPGPSAGQVLTLSSGASGLVPAWKTPAGSPLSINPQTGTAYTLALSDAPSGSSYQGIVTMNNAAANTVTVPSSGTVAWQPGTQIQVVQIGIGQTSCAAASGVTINTPSTLNARTQYSTLVLTYYGSNAWVLGGDVQ